MNIDRVRLHGCAIRTHVRICALSAPIYLYGVLVECLDHISYIAVALLSVLSVLSVCMCYDGC